MLVWTPAHPVHTLGPLAVFILYCRWKLNNLYFLLPNRSIYLIRIIIFKVYRYSRVIFKFYYPITKNNLIKTKCSLFVLFGINCLLIYFYQIFYKMHLSCIIFNSNYTKSENKFEWELDKKITKHYFCKTIYACMPLGKIILVHYFVIQTKRYQTFHVW